jgi:hypothetical protein
MNSAPIFFERGRLRLGVNDPAIVDMLWFWRRAHRALCQDDGIILSSEDFVRRYRRFCSVTDAVSMSSS